MKKHLLLLTTTALILASSNQIASAATITYDLRELDEVIVNFPFGTTTTPAVNVEYDATGRRATIHEFMPHCAVGLSGTLALPEYTDTASLSFDFTLQMPARNEDYFINAIEGEKLTIVGPEFGKRYRTTVTYSGTRTADITPQTGRLDVLFALAPGFRDQWSPMEEFNSSLTITNLHLDYDPGNPEGLSALQDPENPPELTDLAPVPEPATLLLFSTGSALAGWFTRRREKTS